MIPYSEQMLSAEIFVLVKIERIRVKEQLLKILGKSVAALVEAYV